MFGIQVASIFYKTLNKASERHAKLVLLTCRLKLSGLNIGDDSSHLRAFGLFCKIGITTLVLSSCWEDMGDGRGRELSPCRG